MKLTRMQQPHTLFMGLAILLAVTTLLLNACTSQSGSSFRVISSTPTDTQTGVSVNDLLTVILSTSADPSTISNESVYVMDQLDYRLPAELSYNNDTQSIEIDIQGPLYWGTEYTLVLNGVTSASGSALPVTYIEFKTFVNPRKRQIRYDLTDEIQDYKDYSYTADGKRERIVTVSGAGIDTVWFTADDDVSEYWEYQYQSEENTDLFSRYRDSSNGKGDDGLWFTDDDIPYVVEKTVTDSFGQKTTTSYFGPGGDTLWFTDDDLIIFYQVTTLNEYGLVLTYKFYDDPGVDSLWNTIDDLPQSVEINTYDGSHSTSYLQSSDPGANGIALDSDDPTVGHVTRTYNSGGAPLKTIFYDDAGADTLWGTDDDVVSAYFEQNYDVNGVIHQGISYSAPGDDGFWFTDDDPISAISVSAFSADNTQYQSIGYSDAGTDTDWETADDLVSSYRVIEYNVDHVLTDHRYYTEDGLNDVWFTDDDTLGEFEINSLNANSQVTGSYTGTDAGVDGIPMTGDDGPTSQYYSQTYADNGNRLEGKAYLDPGDDLLWQTDDDGLYAIFEFYTDF